MKQRIPITMKDIAEHFGVSVATVSRALNDNKRISEEVRQKIQQYANDNNFFPNIIGAQLRHAKTNPSKIIGVIIPQLPHYYFSTILQGIETEAARRGYIVAFAQSNEDYERERHICREFLRNQVCGVIVSQAKNTFQYDHFQELIDNNVPLVFYDRISTGVSASRVVVDDYQGAYKAVSYLIQTGCTKIAFFNAPETLEISKNRFNGYKDALLKHGIPFDESLVYPCDNRYDAQMITPQILNSEQRPDAFFAINDDTALGILYSAKKMGFSIPDDISICGFSNDAHATSCDPMLTSVEQQGKEVGIEATDILINLVEGEYPKDHIEKRIVRTHLIIRGTTK